MPVVTTHVQSKAVAVTIPAVGTAEAVSSVQIRAQVTGQLSDVHFAEGQEVTKGQPLFTLDPRPFEAALQQAQAVLARDTATAKNALSQQARYEDLYKRGLIPRDQYETQEANATSLQATLAADQAAVETAKLNVQYTKIAAPISGRTGALGVHIGDLVRANDTTAMVVINQLTPIYVTFSVPGRYLTDIRRYQTKQPLTIQTRGQVSMPPGAQPQAPALGDARRSRSRRSGASQPMETGKVSFIDNTVDAHDRHDQAERDVSQHRSRALARPVRPGHVESDAPTRTHWWFRRRRCRLRRTANTSTWSSRTTRWRCGRSTWSGSRVIRW